MSTLCPLRLLVAGHVNGNVTRLLQRVCNLSKKTEFDALLVAGDLFPSQESDQPVDLSWMRQLLDDDEAFLLLPSSIYVFGPRTESQKKFYRQMIKEAPAGDTDIVNEDDLMSQGFDALNGKITVLGKRGIMKCSSGLTIAYYLDDPASKGEELDQFLATINSSSSAIDIFITPSWPKDVHNASTVAIPDAVVERSQSGSDLLSRLANRLKPRYFFSASEPHPDSAQGIFFERQPYRNHTVLKEALRPVTRFISIASVSSDKKGPKWLYAFNIKPSSALIDLDKQTGSGDGRQELNLQPGDTTESPFKGMYFSYGTNKKSVHDDVQFFYGKQPEKRQREDARQRQNNYRPRDYNTEQQEERPKRQRPELDPKDCWFCLASPNLEKEFIVSVADNAYLATAKGGLVEEHLLILPIEHIRSTLDTSEEDISDIKKFKEALVKYFDSQGKIVAFFERNFKSQHMQIQVVPMARDCLMEGTDGSGDGMLPKTIIAMIRERGLHYTVIPKELSLRETLNQGIPYFHLEIPAIDWQICVNINTRRKNGDGSNILFPMQLGREIIAQILGLDPALSHWKNIVLSKDQEAARAIEFRKKFKDFDFTMEDE